jgi:hypothetical protein
VKTHAGTVSNCIEMVSAALRGLKLNEPLAAVCDNAGTGTFGHD